MRALRRAPLLLVCAVAAAAVPEYEALRSARPDGRKVTVRDLTLARDAYTLRFENGSFHLLAPVSGTTFGAVFLGRGSYELDPATEGERQHLRLVTGEKELKTLTDEFENLVLFFTDETAGEILAHAPLSGESPDARAVSFYERYLEHQKETIQINIHLRVLMDLLHRSDRAGGLFVAAVDGKRHAPGVIIVDPLGISSFAAKLGFLGGEQVAFLSVDGQDEGVWYLCALKKEAAEGYGRPALQLVDAEHYAIRTTIDGTRIEGRTRIRIRPLVDGLRVLPLHILPALRLSGASLLPSGAGVAPSRLEIIQEEIARGRIARLFMAEVADADAAVVFPTPLVRGEPVEIEIEYEGSEVIRGGDGTWSVGARTSWYPNFGSFSDLATYELTYLFPKRNQIVSVGRFVDERVEGDKRVAIWKSDAPMRVAGFNYGEFRKLSRTDESTGVEIDVYTGREWRKKAEDAMADAMNTVRVAELFFGPTPFEPISVSQQAEWGFGQSWPSLIFLPTLALTTSTERAMDFGFDARALSAVNEFAMTVGWHEIAHQWWGHQVGWEGYRDQWLSEGFAEFTSALVLQLTESPKRHDAFWKEKSRQILRSNHAGAISQGLRLATRREPEAARAIIYSKGAWVVQMLRMMLHDQRTANPDEAFIAMMRDFVTSWAGKNPSTSDFQAVVERHMTPGMNAAGDGKMTWFFDQWVRGTSIPRLESTLAAAPSPGGKFRISGTVRQEQVPEDFLTVVPMYLDFGREGLVRMGTVRLAGSAPVTVNVELPLPRAPERVLVNAMQDVLARE